MHIIVHNSVWTKRSIVWRRTSDWTPVWTKQSIHGGSYLGGSTDMDGFIDKIEPKFLTQIFTIRSKQLVYFPLLACSVKSKPPYCFDYILLQLRMCDSSALRDWVITAILWFLIISFLWDFYPFASNRWDQKLKKIMSTSQPIDLYITTQLSKMEAGLMNADEFQNNFLNLLTSRFEH